MLDFNINHHVWVKLTPLGRKVWADYWGGKMSLKEDGEGWSEHQLWTLMPIFGPRIGNGFPLVFETTIRIPLPEPEAERHQGPVSAAASSVQ